MSETRKKVHQALQLMAKRNDVIQDTHGNVSAKVFDALFGVHVIYIKPSGVPYDQISEDDVCGVELLPDGSTVNFGHLKPSVDLVHHVNIYRNNPHIHAICHTHSPHVVAHAIAGMSIPCLCTEHADYFGAKIECADYRDLHTWGNIFVATSEKALLLESHGGLTFSDDPVKAVNLAIQLENVARKNILSQALFHPNFEALSKEEIKKWHDRYNNVYGQR